MSAMNKERTLTVILIVLAILLLAYMGHKRGPTIDYQNMTFDRPDVGIQYTEFQSLSDLRRYLKRKKIKYATNHKGASKWYLNTKGEPVGPCDVYFVSGDLETKAHEERHCREGQFHYHKP